MAWEHFDEEQDALVVVCGAALAYAEGVFDAVEDFEGIVDFCAAESHAWVFS